MDQSLSNESRFEKPSECPVCYEANENLGAMSTCGHWICRDCLLRSVEHQGVLMCPMCRTLSDVDMEHQCAMRVCHFIMEDEKDVALLPENLPFMYRSMVCENVLENVRVEMVVGMNYGMYVTKNEDEHFTARDIRHLRRRVNKSKEAKFAFSYYVKAAEENLGVIRFKVKKINKDLTFLSVTCHAEYEMHD